MSYSKKIYAYPHAVRSLFYALAQSGEPIERRVTFSNKKMATAERGKLYHLRKLLAEFAESTGDVSLSERFFTIGIKLEKTASGYELVLFNQHTAFSEELMGLAEEFAGQSPHMVTAPGASKEEMEALQRKLMNQIEDESDSTVSSLYGIKGDIE